jgi:hypothetical protein
MKIFRSIALILFATLLVIFSGSAMRAAAASKDSTVDPQKVQYLLVQTAHGVSFHGDAMTLHGVAPTTLFFSDRPERIVGHGATEEYVADWAKGADSFAGDPPNATLSILGGEGGEINDVVVTLQNPRQLDGNLTYTVKVMDGTPPASGGASALFIDVVGRPLSPVSVAGVRRREVRRAIN